MSFSRLLTAARPPTMPRKPLPEPSIPGANLTPMIDVVFQLIIFFMLVAQFGREAAIELTLPRVAEMRVERLDPEDRVIINVVPRPELLRYGGTYRVGLRAFPETVAGLRDLADELRAVRSRRPDAEVFVRASRNEPYSRVHPAVQAATIAGMKRIHLATRPLGGGSSPGAEGTQQ